MAKLFKPVLAAATLLAFLGCQTLPDASTLPPESASAKSDTMDKDISPREREIVDKLLWLETANPVKDAQFMLSTGSQPVLMAFASRAISFPGLNADQYDAIENAVSYKVADGSGDVIYGDAHLKLRQKLSLYAKAFNQTIYQGVTQP